jgi:tight adherence protein B
MKRLALLAAVGLLAALVACSVASAASLRVTRASGARFPDRAFLLTFAARQRLNRAQISVSENGTPVVGVSVVPASSVGESHFGTVLLIDRSNSMAGSAIQNAILAARTFVRVRNPQQPVGIVFFSAMSRVIVPLTSDTAKLENALATVPSTTSGTHIFDAAATALRMIVNAHLAAGSIVLLSDGQDTGSTTSEAAFADQARSRGVAVYTIGVRDPSFTGSTLESLATQSNGLYTPLEASALPQFYGTLGVALSNQYLIRYRSAAPLAESVRVAVQVAGVGSAVTDYATPTLVSGLKLSPSHVSGSTFWTSAAGSLLIIVACALLIGFAVHVVLTRREGVRARVFGFVRASIVEPARPRTLVQRALGDPETRRVRSPWLVRLAEDLDIAGVEVAVGRLALITAVATALLGFLLVSATSSPLAALLALSLPALVLFGIRYLANRQRRLFDEQLPDNLTVIASALRAGQTFVGSLGVMIDDAPEPSRREFRRALADEALGFPLSDSLAAVGNRMRSTDFHQVALVATLQRDTGGNTAEVIDVVVETVRDRLDLRRLIRSLTAQGRLAGGILSTLPVFLLIVITLVNPHYMRPLFHNPAGIAALVLGAIMVIAGTLIIQRIVNIEV